MRPNHNLAKDIVKIAAYIDNDPSKYLWYELSYLHMSIANSKTLSII
jgi:hypothetical protein